ncbi:MAG: hypothetical protein IIB59_03135 [Planctomycetes bacterium]|nr:hypothetical protein [Planctomycetota bacterium]
MTAIGSDAFHRVLVWWVDLVCRRAGFVVAATLLLTAMAGWYVAANLAISTSTTDMLSAELQFRKDESLIDRLFPQHVNNIVVVVDGATPDQADDAADAAKSTASAGCDFKCPRLNDKEKHVALFLITLCGRRERRI